MSLKLLINFYIFVLTLTPPDQLHSVPIAQMGNYQDFLKAAPQPLRDADPEQPKRLHTFGNPFKLDKKVIDDSVRERLKQVPLKLTSCLVTFSVSQGMMIDEADEFVTGPQSKGKRPGDGSNMPGGGPKRRRCMSPLLRLGRAYTPPVTPPASPRPTSGQICCSHVLLIKVVAGREGKKKSQERPREISLSSDIFASAT